MNTPRGALLAELLAERFPTHLAVINEAAAARSLAAADATPTAADATPTAPDVPATAVPATPDELAQRRRARETANRRRILLELDLHHNDAQHA